MGVDSTNNWIGAKWWKFDFHTHTPASDDYGKGSNQQQLMNITPKEWLLNFMKAQIDCVAITDHNSGEWVDQLNTAFEEMRNAEKQEADFREMYLFPGVEISANGGIHILAIFKLNENKDKITEVLALAGYDGTKGKSDAVTSKSVKEVIQIIHDKGGIAIPAHIDQASGLLDKFSGNSLNQILDNSITALEVVDLTSPLLSKLGTRNLPLVLSSDSHHPTGTGNQSYPGKSFTWVKMGNPSLDGLKLALMDGVLSIKRSDENPNNPNEHSLNYIESINIENSKYIGRIGKQELKLNPWMNSFIGGRGTGKSSIVEFVRLVMRREDEIPENLKSEFIKYNEIPENRSQRGLLTADSKFSLVYVKNNTQYKINWEYTDSGLNSIESWDGNEWIKEEGNIKERFPISIYSQKQIYSFADNPKYLIDVISQQKEVGYRDWESKKEELENKFYSYKNKLRELKLTLDKEVDWKGELSDISKKIITLEEKGFKDILIEYQKRQNQNSRLNSWELNFAEIPDKISSITEEIILINLPNESIADSDEADEDLKNLIQTVNAEVERIKSSLSEQAKSLIVALEKWNRDKKQSIWIQRFNNSIKNYDETLKDLSANSTNAQEEFGKLFQVKQDLESKIHKIESTKKECSQLEQDIETVLRELLEHRKNLSTKRQEFLDKVFQSNQSVKIEIIPFGNKQGVEAKLREILNTETGFDKIIGSIDSDDGLVYDLYSNGISEDNIIDLKKRIKGLLIGQDFTQSVRGYTQFKERILKLPSQSIDQLELFFPEDSLNIEYKNAREQYQPIDQGSPGQKTAALLSFVLSYGSDPIILDQPEDDLDNRLIYELIVKQLKESKVKRQIIVVTHNANIVVNGDSELVYCLESKYGQTNLETKGCLQDKKIREEICSILEGGKDAFQMRYKRIEPYV
ncbi:MAG: hypothetical protein MH321_08690 [Leptospiraceae bacterium]|nr:hypothetical protein [Leptospiraceae bacterium]